MAEIVTFGFVPRHLCAVLESLLQHWFSGQESEISLRLSMPCAGLYISGALSNRTSSTETTPASAKSNSPAFADLDPDLSPPAQTFAACSTKQCASQRSTNDRSTLRVVSVCGAGFGSFGVLARAARGSVFGSKYSRLSLGSTLLFYLAFILA